MQLAYILALEDQGCVVSIVRKTLPALRSTAYKDFLGFLERENLYNEANHNKSELTYRVGRSEVEFFSVDDAQKVRGRKRKYLFCNEANELEHEDFKQLNMRTTGRVYMDYNPSDEYHWIYDHILTRTDVTLIRSTFRDNPFLEPEIIQEIERFKETDENYWRIYGLGLRGVSNTKIYPNWKLCDALPSGGERLFGLDFGHNHPTAFTEVVLLDDNVYAKERIYKSGLLNADRIRLLDAMVEEGTLTKSDYIYADSEAKEFILEIAEAGYNIIGADKGPGSVKKGIDMLKTRGFYITKDSPNLQKEAKSYSWKVKKETNIVLDEPVKLNDDGMDSIRYPVYTHLTADFVGFA